MRLTPPSVNPSRLFKPTNVAKRLGVHPSMVTHWMQGGSLDYLEIDETKFIPEESIAILEALREKKAADREAVLAK